MAAHRSSINLASSKPCNIIRTFLSIITMCTQCNLCILIHIISVGKNYKFFKCRIPIWFLNENTGIIQLLSILLLLIYLGFDSRLVSLLCVCGRFSLVCIHAFFSPLVREFGPTFVESILCVRATLPIKKNLKCSKYKPILNEKLINFKGQIKFGRANNETWSYSRTYNSGRKLLEAKS